MKTLKKKLINKKDSSPKDFLDDNYSIERPEGNESLKRVKHANYVAELMQMKEEKHEKGRKEKVLFLSIGFCLSMLMILGAFEWKNYSDGSYVNMNATTANFEDLVDIPQTEQQAPPPPKVEQPQIVEVPDEEVIEQDVDLDLDVEITEETVIQEVIVSMPKDVEEETADEIFTIVEQQPAPDGGMAAFYKYVGDNLKYPAMATRMNIQGRVFVQFVVEKDGSLTDIQVVKGIGAGCDEEAVRVLSDAPKWQPGKQRGRPVRVRMILPIVFKLV